MISDKMEHVHYLKLSHIETVFFIDGIRLRLNTVYIYHCMNCRFNYVY